MRRHERFKSSAFSLNYEAP